jgi:hypothetical protein
MTAAIVLLNYSWQKLQRLIATLPEEKRRIRFNLRLVTDQNEHYKLEYIGTQFTACIFLAGSLFCALIAIFEMTGIIVGDVTGIFINENFEFAVVAMRCSVVLIFMSIFCMGIVYMEEMLALYSGKPSIASTPLNELPKLPIAGKGRASILYIILLAYFLTVVSISIFVPYNQWIKMLMVLVLGILILIIYRLCLKASLQKNNGECNAKDG